MDGGARQTAGAPSPPEPVTYEDARLPITRHSPALSPLFIQKWLSGALERPVANLHRLFRKRPLQFVSEADVSHGLDQELYDLPVMGAAIAEDDRLEQRGPMQTIDMIHIGAGLDQRAYRLDVAMAARARIELRTILNVVFGIDVGASVDEHLGRLDSVGVGGCQKRCGPTGVARINLGSFSQKPLDTHSVISCRCIVQWCVTHGHS